jgi:tRNA(Ile2) C34 agmatinyltransferase TiaS
MTCPHCGARMTHQGYFSWSCETCGHRCEGELPSLRRGEDELPLRIAA